MNWPAGAGNGEGSLQESAPENGGYWRFCATGKTSYHRRTTSTFLSHKNVKYADNKTPIPNVYYYTCKKINDQ